MRHKTALCSTERPFTHLKTACCSVRNNIQPVVGGYVCTPSQLFCYLNVTLSPQVKHRLIVSDVRPAVTIVHESRRRGRTQHPHICNTYGLVAATHSRRSARLCMAHNLLSHPIAAAKSSQLIGVDTRTTGSWQHGSDTAFEWRHGQYNQTHTRLLAAEVIHHVLKPAQTILPSIDARQSTIAKLCTIPSFCQETGWHNAAFDLS